MRERGVEFDFPYDKSSFKDRYTRQSRSKPCSTIVAHLSKDGLMFIHPTQNRTLTPREAARVQSFPDWFRFPAARTHAFRLIGNAVPPLVGEAVGLEIRSFLETADQLKPSVDFQLAPLPASEPEAVAWILPLLELDARALRRIPLEGLKRAWFATSFLYPGLHPDSALDHGTTVCDDVRVRGWATSLDHRLTSQFYERSGWPTALEGIAQEAWRRYELGELADDEFYCAEAQLAGMCHRDPLLAKTVGEERDVSRQVVP
jgi:DNA (cytosine-5)-methyltransferase 1